MCYCDTTRIIMELIIITILFVSTLAFIFFWQDKREKAEQSRFREFVIANKAKNTEEYVGSLPSSEEMELPQQDEIMDVNEVDPEKLLEAIRNENANK